MQLGRDAVLIQRIGNLVKAPTIVPALLDQFHNANLAGVFNEHLPNLIESERDVVEDLMVALLVGQRQGSSFRHQIPIKPRKSGHRGQQHPAHRTRSID